MKTVTLYTDGACSGNPGHGGWGAILEFNVVEKELSGGESATTNNRMELTAVIRGLEALKEPCIVELYSDSKYVIDALEKGWAWGWKKRGWVKSDKKPALNPDLWETLLTVTVNGYGKRTELSEYLRTGANGEKCAQSRGGKGLKNYNITPKTGNVAGCRIVAENDDVMLIENGGVIIRIPASSINVYKRDVQGVIVMRIEEGNQVVSLERVEKVDEEEVTQ